MNSLPAVDGQHRFRLLYNSAGIDSFDTLELAKARASELASKNSSMPKIGFDILDRTSGRIYWGVLLDTRTHIRLYNLLVCRYKQLTACQ